MDVVLFLYFIDFPSQSTRFVRVLPVLVDVGCLGSGCICFFISSVFHFKILSLFVLGLVCVGKTELKHRLFHSVL